MRLLAQRRSLAARIGLLIVKQSSLQEGEVVDVEGHGLSEAATHCEHREASVLKLLGSHQLHALLGARCQGAQSEISGVLERQVLKAKTDLLEADGLDGADDDHQVPHQPLAQAGTNELVVRSDDIDGRVGGAIDRQAESIGDDETEEGKHRHTPVLELGLTEPREQGGVALRQADGVELVLTEAASAAHQATCELLSPEGCALALAHGQAGCHGASASQVEHGGAEARAGVGLRLRTPQAHLAWLLCGRLADHEPGGHGISAGRSNRHCTKSLRHDGAATLRLGVPVALGRAYGCRVPSLAGSNIASSVRSDVCSIQCLFPRSITSN